MEQSANRYVPYESQDQINEQDENFHEAQIDGHLFP